MNDPEIVRNNARVQAWSSLFMNLGGGLAAAVSYRCFVETRIDLNLAAWTIMTAALIFGGQRVLDLLEAEE